jgi:hypothetical protein
MGGTQGDRLVSTPDRRAVDQDALIDERSVSPAEHLRAEEVHRVLLAIEIDDKIDEILEFGLSHELAQDRLRLAGRAPSGMDRDEDRLAGFLRRCKVVLIERLGLGGKCGCNKDGACGGGNERGAS